MKVNKGWKQTSLCSELNLPVTQDVGLGQIFKLIFGGRALQELKWVREPVQQEQLTDLKKPRVFADRGEKDLDSKMVKGVTLQSANHPKQC